MKQRRCIIIGAGIGGLAAAVRIAATNYEVLVLEKNDTPGGKIQQIQKDGFRFDTGPSLFTLPHMVTDVLNISNTPNHNLFHFRKLHNVCRYFYEDGTIINVPDEPLAFANEIEKKTGEPAEHILKYLKTAENRYLAAADMFIFNPIDGLFKSVLRKQPKELEPLLAVNPVRTMHEENQKYFRSPHVIQLFDRYATYNGSSPYQASSILNMISHLEHNDGAFFPKKGMYSIVEAIYQKALQMGVEFRFGSKVIGLKTEKRSIRQVITPSEQYSTDIVISDVDVNTFYRNQAQQLRKPRTVRKPALSSSALIFYWGMKRSHPQLDVHNILFSNDYKNEFSAIFEKQQLFNDPTVYIFISSKAVKSDAPEGMENWFVMINVPPTGENGQQVSVSEARSYIISKIKRTLNMNPEKELLFEEKATPITIEERTGSFRGALYGNHSNSLWSAFLRHRNRSGEINNLFFTGGSVHPGGGIPLCLASAEIVKKEIDKLWSQPSRS